MKKLLSVILTIVLILALTLSVSCAKAEPVATSSTTDATVQTAERTPRVRKDLENIAETERAGVFTCTYDGESCNFVVCLPEECGENTPLVVMLHGFPGTGEGMKTDTHFDEAACPRGYAIVYATSPSGWNSLMKTDPTDDIGYIEALTEYVRAEYGLSKNLAFAAGFSNGAFMTQYLAVDSAETFSAVACVAGMMPKKVWEMRSERANIGVLDICGTKDDVVPQNRNDTAKTSPNPAIEVVMEYWVEANGLDKSETSALSEAAELTKYTGGDGENQVWTVVIEDGRHSWPTEKTAGFDANALILDFFDTYRE